ncbi:MAG: hypothetical protein AVDCRST_MAG79-262, partial [uncultured Thermoleophilia bacterium]
MTREDSGAEALGGSARRRRLTAELRVSIVIPTLREAAALPATLDHLASLAGDLEVIVADGGSDDGTPQVAAAHPRTDAVVEVRGGG